MSKSYLANHGRGVKHINLARKHSGIPRENWRIRRAITNLGNDKPRLVQFAELRRVWSLAIKYQQAGASFSPVRYGARRPRGRRNFVLSRTLSKLEAAKKPEETTAIPGALVHLDDTEVRLLSEMLTLVLKDEDAREVVWESLAHRPKDTHFSQALALYVVLRVRAGVAEKVCKLDLMQLAGVTQPQVKHALAEHRRICEETVESFDDAGINTLRVWNLQQLQRSSSAKNRRNERERRMRGPGNAPGSYDEVARFKLHQLGENETYIALSLRDEK